MIKRKIECDEFNLTGIKIPSFPYEILIPENYYIIYGRNRISDHTVVYYQYDLDKDYFKNKVNIDNKKEFNGSIIFMNSEIKVCDNIPEDISNLSISNKKELIEIYKNIISKAVMVGVFINKHTNHIYEITVDYLTHADHDKGEYKNHRIFLLSKNRFDWVKYVLKEEY